MIPDAYAPDTCQTCGAEKSHDLRQIASRDLLHRVYKCGASVSLMVDSLVRSSITCPRSTEIIAQLRADNVLMAMELQAIADAAEKQLGGWATAPLDAFGYLWDLRALRDILDLATEALEGQPAAAAAAPSEPDQGQLGLEQTTAARVGERS